MKRALLLLSLVAVLMASCALIQKSDLSSARSRWDAAHLKHYRYTLYVNCFCYLANYEMPILVEVRSDGTMLMADKNGTSVSNDDKQAFDEYAPISHLFDYVEQMIGNVFQLDVAYDAKYGFPGSVNVNGFPGSTDSESSVSVTDFQPLP